MSDKEIFNFIANALGDIKAELAQQREHGSHQIGRCHKRIDEITEKFHNLRNEMKERDVLLEKRIGTAGLAYAVGINFFVEIFRLVLPLLAKMFN